MARGAWECREEGAVRRAAGGNRKKRERERERERRGVSRACRERGQAKEGKNHGFKTIVVQQHDTES